MQRRSRFWQSSASDSRLAAALRLKPSRRRINYALTRSRPQTGPAETDATPPVASEPIAGTELPPPGASAQTTPASEAAPAPVTAAPPLSGTPKIALLLPLSASGGTGTAAQALKNAADLAMADLPGASVELIVKDERGIA